MSGRLFLLMGTCVLLQVFSCFAGFAQQGAFVGGEVLVKFMEHATEADRKAVESEYSLVLVKHHAPIGIYHYRSDAEDIWTLVANVRSSPFVYFAEPNYVRKKQSAPNDEFYDFQWYLPKIGWEGARAAFTGTSPVIVAVIDSGVTKLHKHLEGYRAASGEWDFVQNDNDATDESGHGTMVAGIITGATGDGKGVAGISPTARILPIRVFDNAGFVAEGPSVDVSVLIAALDQARSHGARIINLSLGGSLYSFSEQLALSACDSAGILLVCAAGNGDAQGFGVNNDESPIYPASYDLPGIISVAATDDENQLAVFSNFGTDSVDIAAPGQFIVGCDVPRRTLYNWDFSSGPQGWTSDVVSGNGWIWTSFLGDWGVFSRSLNSWGFYAENSSMFLDSPIINLAGQKGARAEIEFSALQVLGFGDYMSLSTETGSGTQFVDLIAYPWSDANQAMRDISHLDGQIGWLSIYFKADLYGGFLNTSSRGMLGITNVRVTVLDQGAFATEAVWYADGTSFAAPIVSGVAAMMMSQNPQLTHLQVRQKIMDTASRVMPLSGKLVTGGVVNAQAALDAAIASQTPLDQEAPTLEITAPNIDSAPIRISSLVLRGSATDNVTPTRLEYRVRRPDSQYSAWTRVRLRGAGKTRNWSQSLELPTEGKWLVQLRVSDAARNRRVITHTITVDRTPPVLSITSPSKVRVSTKARRYTLSGATADNITTSRIEWRAAPPGGRYGGWQRANLRRSTNSKPWSLSVRLNIKGEWAFQVRAVDQAGNSSLPKRVRITRL